MNLLQLRQGTLLNNTNSLSSSTNCDLNNLRCRAFPLIELTILKVIFNTSLVFNRLPQALVGG